MTLRTLFVLHVLVFLTISGLARTLTFHPLKAFGHKEARAYFFPRNNTNDSPSRVVLYAGSLERVTPKNRWRFSTPEDCIAYSSSSHGRFIGFLQKVESDSFRRSSELQFSVLNPNGQIQSVLHFSHFYDDPIPAFAVSDKDGSVIAGQSATGTVWFYGSSGRLLKEVDLFPDDEYALERSLQIHISANGEQITVLATKRPASPADAGVPDPAGYPALFLFDTHGNELWRYELPGMNAGSIAMSDRGDQIFASSYTVRTDGHARHTSILFDDHGQALAEFDLSFRQAHFSTDGRWAILVDNDHAALVDAATRRIVWNFKCQKPMMIADASLSHNGKVAVVLRARNQFQGGEFVFKEPEIIVLDQQGKPTQSIAVDGTFVTPAISLSPNARYIYLGLQNSLQIFTAE